jgi:ATP-dependent Clp protease ATP-binding subunit ClpB
VQIHHRLLNQFIRVLDEYPSIVGNRTQGWTALHVAVINRRSNIIDLLLPRCLQYINRCDIWDGNAHRPLFASDQFPHRVLQGSSPLHYACLTGDMEIVKKLLRAGADKELRDDNSLIPEKMIDCSSGDDKKVLYRKICEEEEERRRLERIAEEEARRKRAEEEERRRLERVAEVEELKRRVEECTKSKPPDQSTGSDSQKDDTDGDSDGDTNSDGNGTVNEDEEADALQRFRKESAFSQSSLGLYIVNAMLICPFIDPIEKIIGNNIIGQKGPVRSVASAIRLRENGWVDPNRPLVLLFLGSSGVGKTEMAKQITYYNQRRHGKDETDCDGKYIDDIEKSGAFIRIDMSEFQQSHSVANLTGMLYVIRGSMGSDIPRFRFSKGLRGAYLCLFADRDDKRTSGIVGLRWRRQLNQQIEGKS